MQELHAGICIEQGFQTAFNPDDLGVILSDSGAFRNTV